MVPARTGGLAGGDARARKEQDARLRDGEGPASLPGLPSRRGAVLRFYAPAEVAPAPAPAESRPRVVVLLPPKAPPGWRAAAAALLAERGAVDAEVSSGAPSLHPPMAPPALLVVAARAADPGSRIAVLDSLAPLAVLAQVLPGEVVDSDDERFALLGEDSAARALVPTGSIVPVAALLLGASLPADRALARLLDGLAMLTDALAGRPVTSPGARVLVAPGEAEALVFLPDGVLRLRGERAERLALTPEPAEWRVTRLAGFPWRGTLFPPEREVAHVVAELRAPGGAGASLLALRRADKLEAHGLVRVDELLAGGVVELRYKEADNFTRKVLYPPHAACYLAHGTADALLHAHQLLAREGLGLLVYDCYRPRSVQALMWKVIPDARYVAPPDANAPHGRGVAVDVGLVDARGRPLEMPTAHDDFSARAAPTATAGISLAALHNRAHLREAMLASGFAGNRSEWWHYTGPGGLPTLDLPFPRPDETAATDPVTVPGRPLPIRSP